MTWKVLCLFAIVCLIAAASGVENGRSESSSVADLQSLQDWASMAANDPSFSIAIPLDRDPLPAAFGELMVEDEARGMAYFGSSSSKRDGFVPLYDCARRGFNVNISLTIGSTTQYFRIMVDTGSSNVVVVSPTCTACPVPHIFTPPSGVQPVATNIPFTTGSGTTISNIYVANVSITGLTGSAVNNAQIYAATSTTGTFFTPVGCFLDVNTLTNGDGLFGLGPQTLSGSSGTSIMDALGKPSMAFQHCESGGTLWLGQPNATYFSEPIQYTTLYEQPYYAIHPTAIAVDGVDLNFTATDFASTGNTILDNGATNMFFPTAVYNAIMAKLNANNLYYSYFGSNWAVAGPCIAFPTSPINTPYINAHFPNITITWESGANMTIRAVDGYLQQILKSDGLVYYCNNIAATSGSMRLGLAAHAQFIFQYDRPGQRFGFARTKTCNNYWALGNWSSCCSGMKHRVPYCADRFGNRLVTRLDSAYMCQESNPFTFADMNQACSGSCTYCPVDVDAIGLTWSAAELTTQTQACPAGYQGVSGTSRFCDFGGVWRTSTSTTDCLPVPGGFKLISDSQSIPQSLISPLDAQQFNSAGTVGNVSISVANNLPGVVMAFVAWDCTALAEDATLNATTGCTNGTIYRTYGYSNTANNVITYNNTLILAASGYVQIWRCTSNPLNCYATQVFSSPAPFSYNWGNVVAPGGTLLAISDYPSSTVRVYRCFDFTASPPCTTTYVTIPPYPPGLGASMAMSDSGILAMTATGNTNIVLLYDCTLTDPLSCTPAKNLTITSAATAPLKFVGSKLVIIQDSWLADWSGSSVPSMVVYNCPLDAASCTQLSNTTSGLISGVVFKGMGLSMASFGNMLAIGSPNAKPLSGTVGIVNQGAVILMISDNSPGGFSVITAVSPSTIVNSERFAMTVGISGGIISVSCARKIYSDARPLWVLNTCDTYLPGSYYNSVTGTCILPTTPVTPPSVPIALPSPPPSSSPSSNPPVTPPTVVPPTSSPQFTPQTSPTASPPQTAPSASSPTTSNPTVGAPTNTPSTPINTPPTSSSPSLQPQVEMPTSSGPSNSPPNSNAPVGSAPQGTSDSARPEGSGTALLLFGTLCLLALQILY